MAPPSTTETHKIKIFMTGLRVTAEVPQYFRDLYGSPDEIEAKILADKQRIVDAGYDVTLYYIDERDPEGSLDHMGKTLRTGNFDGIMIGTGLRLIPPQTALFEKAVNVARRASPQSLFLYNDGPGGNYDAIKRNDEVNAYIR